jgi:competence protein ComEC
VTSQPVSEFTRADLYFMNVGQGDCTLIVDGASRQGILIDCPPGQAIVKMLKDFLSSARINLFAAIVTHWDIDHYGGLARISQYARPDHVYYNHDTLFTDDPRQGRFIKTTLQAFLDLTKLGTELHGFRYQDEVRLGSISVRFLAPTQEEVTRAYLAGRRNVASAVVSVSVDSLRALIGGDAVAATWERLLGSAEDLSASVLRWPHHGAMLHGGSNELVGRVLDAVSPERVIVSVGFGNRYIHPSKDVISLASSRAHVYCTEVTGHCFGFSSKVEQSTPSAAALLGSISAPACANGVRISVGPTGSITIEPSTRAHQSKIRTWPMPLCMRSSAAEQV